MLVKENTVFHWFTKHSLILTNTTFDFNNALVNVEINIKIHSAEVLFILSSC